MTLGFFNPRRLEFFIVNNEKNFKKTRYGRENQKLIFGPAEFELPYRQTFKWRCPIGN